MFATLQAIDREGKPKRSSLNERFQTKDTNNVDSKQLLIKINEMQVNQNESRGSFDEFHWHQFRRILGGCNDSFIGSIRSAEQIGNLYSAR